MKRGPIGVWFSAALAILIASGWVGYRSGSRFALYWVRHQREKQGTLRGPDRARAESALSTLNTVQMVHLLSAIGRNDAGLSKKYRLSEIRGLDALGRSPGAQEIRPVVDLYVGLACLDAAVADEQANDKVSAAAHISDAQSIFQSLGWRDYSPDALKAVAGRELDKFKLPSAAGRSSK